MPSPIREAYLDNGLKVILKEVHTAPVTSTWLWYRVGSRDEVEGCTGLSHWVEHMMFKGSSQFPKGAIMRAVDREGGYLNAMTSYDFTTYYTTLPSDRAELALRIEADRMTSASFAPDEVDAERTVIIAEREGSENEPRYVLAEEVVAAMFRVHPYHHQTIGWKADLQAITRDQLYAHYRQHYMPNNAVLVVVGDLNAEAHLALIERYFGAIPAGITPSSSARPEPPQHGERRVTIHMPGRVPLVRISYHTPPVSHPDYIPLVVLDAILSGGKAMFAFGDSQARSARLYRALVETQLASSVGSHYHPSLDPFTLSLGATVREGREPQPVEQALLAEIAKLQQEPVSEHELAVAVRQTQAQFAYSSESVTSQALTLGFLDIVDNYQRMDSVLDELTRVTSDDVLRVARTYLGEDNRAVGWFLPTVEGSDTETDPDELERWVIPYEGSCVYTGAAHNLPISPETVTRAKLDNGVTVLIKENPTSASVTIQGDLEAGSVHEPPQAEGLADLTASMLRRGTRLHTFQELNVALDDVGASLSFSAGLDDMGFEGQSLASDFDLLVDLLVEILTEPAFPKVELEKLRGQILTSLRVLAMDTSYQADLAFMSALYPTGHPYARSTLGNRETVASFTQDDIVSFYHQHYDPASVVLSVVGAVETSRVLDKLQQTIGRWPSSGHRSPHIIPAAITPPAMRRCIEIPGKSQVDLIWGTVGMARTSPDYYPAMMANLIMGRLGLAGRLGDRVRDQQGLVYYIASSLHAGPGPHPWDIVAGANPKHVERVTALILEEIARLRDDLITDLELEDSRSYLTGALPLRLETNEGIAGFLLNIEEYGLGLDYLQRYPAIINSVSREDIQRVARQYLTLDRYVLTMAGTFSASDQT